MDDKDNVSVKVEIIADDAVKSAKAVKSATDSMVESLRRAQSMVAGHQIGRGVQQLGPPPRLPVTRSASEQLRSAADMQQHGTAGNAEIIAAMQRRAAMTERLTKQARTLGLSEQLASDYVQRGIALEDAAAGRATRSLAGRLSALSTRAKAVRGEFAAIGRAFGGVGKEVGVSARAIGGAIKAFGSSSAPIGKRFASLGSTIWASFGRIGGKLKGVFSAIGPEIAAVAATGPAALAAVGAAAVTAGAQIASVLTNAIVKFEHAVTQAGIRAQSVMFSFERLFGGAGGKNKAAAQFDEIRHMAQELGLDVWDTLDAYQNLIAADFSPAIAKDIIKMGADLKATGKSAEQVSSVIDAMKQLEGDQIAYSEGLNQQVERGVGKGKVQDMIMHRMGITDEKEYKRKLEAGEISYKIALPAIRDAVQQTTKSKRVGDAAKARADNTVQGQLDQMRAQWENFKIDIGQKEMPGVKRLVTSARATLNSLAQSPALQRIGTALLSSFDRLTVWLEGKGPALVAGLEPAFATIAAVVEFVASAFENFTENAGATNALMTGLGAIAGSVVIGIASLTFVMVMLGGGLLTIIGIFGELINEIGVASSEFSSWIKKITGISLYDAGSNIINSLISGISDNIPGLERIAVRVWDALDGKFKGPSGADMRSPSRKTRAWGVHLSAGLSGGIIASLHQVRGASAALAEAALPPSVPANDNTPRVSTVRGKVGDDGWSWSGGARDNEGGQQGPTVVINLTVEPPPGGTREEGERYGEGVGAGLERQLMRYLSGTALTGT